MLCPHKIRRKEKFMVTVYESLHGNIVQIAPKHWEGKPATIGVLKDRILYSAGRDVLSILKSMGIDAETVDKAEELEFDAVHFDTRGKTFNGRSYSGTVPVAVVKACQRRQFDDYPPQYFVPLELIEGNGKKPAGKVETVETASSSSI
jgi:hypothetical protein